MMSHSKFILAILAMSAVMIALKVLPMIFCKEKIKNKFLRSFLAYIPYAVLTSMVFPEVFYSTSNIISATFGVIAAIALSYFGQSLMVVALSSTAVVFIVEQIIKFIR